MDNLSDLASVLRSLDSDKTTERKKAAERLRNLLSKSSVGQTLTQYSEDKQRNVKGHLTWDIILKAVIGYVRTETEAFQKAKEPMTASAQNLRDRKKQDVSDLFKFVVRTAEKNGGRLKSSLLIGHVMEVMKDKYTCDAFGSDYSNVLLKNILSVRKHWLEISKKNWHELLVLYCNLFLDRHCAVERVIVARLLQVLMQGAAYQCDIQPKKFLAFFTEAFKSIMEHKAMVVPEHLVAALNIFVKAVGPNSRVQICKLGENILPGLLPLWGKNPSDILKDNLVEFMRLQLQAHHPCGALTPEAGAFAVNWDTWKGHIQKLYEVILTDIEQFGGLQRFLSRTKNVLKDSFVEFAADIFQQLFAAGSDGIKITQRSLSGEDSEGMAVKKRRITSGWSTLLDAISSKCNTLKMIPWLQLLNCVLEKYPASLLLMNGVAVLQCLHEALTTCKGSEIYKHIFSCLASLAKSVKRVGIQQGMRDSMRSVWIQVWTSSLSIISSRQAESDGYQDHGFELLEAMLQCNVASPSRQVWNLFISDVTQPTSASLMFLSRLLAMCQIPENFLPNILGSRFATEKGTFPLRKHLLTWVMQSFNLPSSSGKHWTKVNAENMAQLLVQLVLRDPGQLSPHCDRKRVFTTALEKTYLLTTFDCDLNFEKPEKVDGKAAITETCYIIPALTTCLGDMLHCVMKQHLQLTEPQVRTVELLAYDCSILSHCILATQKQHMLITGIEALLQQVMDRLTTLLSGYIKKEGTVGLLPVIRHLQSMIAFKDTSDLVCYQTAEIVRGCISSKLPDLLLDLVNKKLSRSSSVNKSLSRFDAGLSSRSVAACSSRSAPQDMDDFGDFDDDFDMTENCSKDKEEDMDFDFDDVERKERQEGGETQLNTAGCGNILDEPLLSENQVLRNNIVHFLCLLMGFDKHSAPGNVTASMFDITAIRNKTEDLLSEDKFDLTHAADIQMMKLMIETLLSSDHHVTDTDLENIMDVLRRLVRVQRQDQHVCCLVLSLLAKVSPHLNDPEELPSQSKLDCREILLHLISAFWRLQTDNYSRLVRLDLAKCMAMITQHDPDGQWGTLKLARQEPEDETEGSKASVATKFPHCLIDECLSVRLFIASSMKRLFMTELGGKLKPKSRQQQDCAFDQVYEICNGMMDLQGNLSMERQQDEHLNRTASLLLAFSTAAMTSPACEKKALFAMFLAIQDKKIDATLVLKIIQKISTALGYHASNSYLSCHLPYLINQWLKLNYTLDMFPFALLGCDNVQRFYSAHAKVLVPHLFMQGCKDALKNFAEVMESSLEDLLNSCLPEVLVHILPVFAVSKNREVAEKSPGILRQLSNASTCYDLLVKHLGKETIDKNIVSQLGHIVVSIFSCLTLDRGFDSQNSFCDPEPNPPSYTEDVVRVTLDFLTQSFSGNIRSLVAVLAKTADGIEQVLLELCLMMWREQRLHERLRCLQMFSLFVTMMLQELAATQLGGSRAFVLRRVIATLLQLLKPENGSGKAVDDFGCKESITMVSLNLLREVCTAIIECCHEELGTYLSGIVDVVSQLAVQEGETGDTAVEVLNYLLMDNSSVVRPFVASLDPLPHHQAFAKIAKHCERIQKHSGQRTLEKLMDQVMKVSRDAVIPANGFARTLRLLTEAVDSHHYLLASMLMNSQGSNQISQVICELLQLTQSPVPVVMEEAGRCLGAIGPVSLKVASLPRPHLSSGFSQALNMYKGTPFEKYCHVFHRLHQYLIDPSVEVVQTASMVVKKLLATTTGVQFSMDYKEKLANKDDLFQYLHPFRPSKHTKTPPSSGKEANLQEFNDNVNSSAVWEPQHHDHMRWIKDLCVALLQSGAVADSVLCLLREVCLLKVEFCEMLLPYLVHEILSSGCTEHKDVLSQRIAGFFHSHCELSVSASTKSSPFEDLPKSICTNKESVLVMLKVVNYLRTQSRTDTRGKKETTAWDNNFWLDLNYLDVARAAQNCAAHFSAVLFAEIFWDAQRRSGPCVSSVPDQNYSDSSSQSSSILSEGSMDGQAGVQNLLLEALHCIGDPDAVYGCGAGSLPDPGSRVETYLHEKRWEKAVVTLDIQMQQPSASSQLQLLKAVQKCGGDYLVGICLQGFSEEALHQDMSELQYEAAWKAGQWDLDVPSMSDESVRIHQSLYSCLHAVRDNQPAMALHLLDKSRQSLLRTFDMNVESCRSLYPLLCQLQCLRQFELLVNALASSKDNPQSLTTLLGNWREGETTANRAEFEFLEPVYSLRVAAIRLVAAKEGYSHFQAALQDILLHTAKTARVAGFYQMSERLLHEVQHQPSLSTITDLRVQLQLAQLFWARSEDTTAKHVMKTLIKRCQQEDEGKRETMCLLTQSLALYGNWLAETRSETPTVIMEQYLEKTIQLLEDRQDNYGQEAVDGYFSLARYADAQYQNIVNYMKSPTFEAKEALMKKAAAEYEKYTGGGQTQKDRYLSTLEKQSQIDKREVASMIDDRKRFLHHAVRCYASCLQHGDTHDLHIFRLTSLWLDNSASPQVNEVLEECSQKLKSYKFLPLMHQLAARMSTKLKDNQLFLPTLNTILRQAAVDHPYHTLWVLLALAHANLDQTISSRGQSAKRRGKLATGTTASQDTEGRVEAAQMLLEGLKCGSKVDKIVRDMEMLSTAYVELANWPVDQYRKETKPVPLPKTLKIMSVKNLTSVAVPSVDIPVDPSCKYDNVVSVAGYLPTFRLAGGVNLPKIVTCRCSDGIDRRQLVKGRDDLRQDAIMQQVFSLVNRLLAQDPATSRRRLNIRTYKVVPLTRKSGLLEWCEGTQPIGEYLVGSPSARGLSAHSRYRPKDWHSLECRKHMMSVAKESSAETKYKAYMEICKNFQPVFRFFFMEKFLEPAQWFQHRLAYTRSVATNSIVSYILGLGDRHVMNILIDCRSAELIHIDLGVAFEQGRILPTPETVPFRLTRDIVDGMGVAGVEGVFRRCCEKTMEVMRAHQESLMTIVQVLLYDPLSDWTVSPQRAYALQGRRDRKDCDTVDLNVSLATAIDTELDIDGDKSEDSEEPVNKLAERVLLRLQQKLQGLEDRVALSVAGQVNHLIQVARDPRNLSKLFSGWQPYI